MSQSAPSPHQPVAFLPSIPVPHRTHRRGNRHSPPRTPLRHPPRHTPTHPPIQQHNHHHHTAPKCSSTTTPPPPRSIDTWLTENGAKLAPQLNPVPLDSRIKQGVCVNEATPKGTELAVLPESVYLSSRSAKAALQRVVPNIGKMAGARDLAPASWLALQLVYERWLGGQSGFVGLVEGLVGVGCVDAVGLWSEEELEWLKGSEVKGRAEEVGEGVEAEWEGLRGEVMGALVGGGEAGGLEVYRWSVGVVDGRGVNVGGGEVVLGPVLGQCGAGVGGNVRVEVVGGGVFSRRRMVRMVAEGDLEAGEEICLGVAAGVRNADLALERGFVVEDKAADVVEMGFALTGMDRFYEDKIDIVEQYAEGGEREGDVMRFELRDVGGGEWQAPEEMEAFVRLVCLGGTDAFLLEAVFRSEVWGHMNLPVSAENEKAMCDVVVGACEDALEAYGEGVVGEVGDEGRGARARMARRIVEGEKRILRRVAKAYRDRANSLDALEYYAERRLNALDLLRPVDECEIVDSDSGVRVGRAFDENYY